MNDSPADKPVVVLAMLGALAPHLMQESRARLASVATVADDRPLERFDASEFKVKFGGEVKDFSPADHLDIDNKDVRRLDRFCQFAMVAAHKAILSCGMDFNQGDPYRHGVLIGSGIPLFGPLDADVPLRHVATRAFPSGLVQSEYAVAR